MVEVRDTERDLYQLRLRLAIAMGLVLVCFGILVARFVYLQVYRYEDFHAQAEENRIALVPAPPARGLIFDLTWNRSVAQGVQNVAARNPDGDVIFGLSQGAVVASRYKAANPGGTGNTFVLVENPSRPNGGVLSRFEGLHIPVLDVDFSGPTPDNGDLTIDVARQYDGWADFPTYPLNLLATVNAVMGMIYVHGRTQTELTAAMTESHVARFDKLRNASGGTPTAKLRLEMQQAMQEDAAVFRTSESLASGVGRLQAVHDKRGDLAVTDRGLVWNTARQNAMPWPIAVGSSSMRTSRPRSVPMRSG